MDFFGTIPVIDPSSQSEYKDQEEITKKLADGSIDSNTHIQNTTIAFKLDLNMSKGLDCYFNKKDGPTQ